MMKLQIANEDDRKEANLREKRRQAELERRNRIFNARRRKIGVSKTHLSRYLRITIFIMMTFFFDIEGIN